MHAFKLAQRTRQGITNNTKWYLSVDSESMRLNICHA